MTQRDKLYGLISDSAPTLNRHMVVHLRVDRESFDSLKELLRHNTAYNIGRYSLDESPSARLSREALKRVFDQIRDMTYSDV